MSINASRQSPLAVHSQPPPSQPRVRHHRHLRPPRPTITVAQCNVGRRIDCHDAFLANASTLNIDVLLLQEPWVHSELPLRRTRRHGAYRPILPAGGWAARPRVVAYVRAGVFREVALLPSPRPRDIQVFSVLASSGFSLCLVNVYNAPATTTSEPAAAVPALINFLPPSPRCLLAGDVNLPFSPWDVRSGQPPPQQAQALEALMETLQFSQLTGDPVPTHDAGHTLDLVWGSTRLAADGAVADVSVELECGSDHRPLLTTIPSPVLTHRTDTPRFALDSTDPDVFLASLRRSLPVPLPAFPTPDMLDHQASSLLRALSLALAQSTKRRSARRGLPYWTPACSEALQDVRAARTALDRSNTARDLDASWTWLRTARSHLRRSLASARQSHWHERVISANSPDAVCRLANWRRREFRSTMQHLVDPTDGSPRVSLVEKQDLLMRSFTDPTGLAPDDLSLPIIPPSPSPFALPPLSLSEVEAACVGVSSTTPGLDEVAVRSLKLAWPVIKELVLRLFQACVDVGHHPSVFKKANLIVLPKSGDRDRSLPRSYRPISLLSSLGKGLERVLARRMAHLAVTHRVVGPQQFGALPLRGTTDLTSALTHDVEATWASKSVASALTLDVQGAFDAVMPGRLRRRLIEQRWPPSLVNWVFSFMTNRSAVLSLDETPSAPYLLRRGLPHLVSPFYRPPAPPSPFL